MNHPDPQRLADLAHGQGRALLAAGKELRDAITDGDQAKIGRAVDAVFTASDLSPRPVILGTVAEFLAVVGGKVRPFTTTDGTEATVRLFTPAELLRAHDQAAAASGVDPTLTPDAAEKLCEPVDLGRAGR